MAVNIVKAVTDNQRPHLRQNPRGDKHGNVKKYDLAQTQHKSGKRKTDDFVPIVRGSDLAGGGAVNLGQIQRIDLPAQLGKKIERQYGNDQQFENTNIMPQIPEGCFFHCRPFPLTQN